MWERVACNHRDHWDADDEEEGEEEEEEEDDDEEEVEEGDDEVFERRENHISCLEAFLGRLPCPKHHVAGHLQLKKN